MRFFRKFFRRTILLIPLLLPVGLNAETLVIKGSNTLGTTLIPQWIEAFQEQEPHIHIQLSARGSSTGFDALLQLGIDLAASSRRARTEEFSAARARGIILQPTLVCYDGISVIVHESNPLKSLSQDQVLQIFTGAINDWSDVGGTPGPIKRYIRNTDSGTHEDFQTLMLNR